MTTSEVQADLEKVITLLNHVLGWLPSPVENKVVKLMQKVAASTTALDMLTATINLVEASEQPAPAVPTAPTAPATQ